MFPQPRSVLSRLNFFYRVGLELYFLWLYLVILVWTQLSGPVPTMPTSLELFVRIYLRSVQSQTLAHL